MPSSSVWTRVVGPPQHPDQHRSERPILLAVDQQLGEVATHWVAPELSDPVGWLEVGEHQDVEQLGAGSGAESVQLLSGVSFEVHGSTLLRRVTPH